MARFCHTPTRAEPPRDDGREVTARLEQGWQSPEKPRRSSPPRTSGRPTSTGRICSRSTATCWSPAGSRSGATSSTARARSPAASTPGAATRRAAVGVATAMRADDVGTPIQRDMGVHVTRGTEPWRIFAQYMGRARRPRPRASDGNVHMADIRLGLIAMVSHLPAMMPVAVGLRAGLQDPQAAARGAWAGRATARWQRGDAHEAMNLAGRPPAAGRLHHRQQPVRLLDAEPARVRLRAPRRPRRRLRLRGRGRRRHATC